MMGTVDDLAKLVSQVGFPIFVTLYLIARGDQIMREHTKALQDLTLAIRQHLMERK